MSSTEPFVVLELHKPVLDEFGAWLAEWPRAAAEWAKTKNEPEKLEGAACQAAS